MKGASFARKPFKTFSNIGLQVELTSWVGILWPVTPRHVAKVISGHERSPTVFSRITFDRDQLERWKHHKCVQADDVERLICNMTFFGSGHNLDLRSNFQHDLSRLNCISFDAVRQEKHDAGKICKCCIFTKSKVITEKTFIATKPVRYFWSFCSLEAKPLILDQIWGHISERTFKELSNALLDSTVALLLPELRASLSKNVEIGQIWPLVTSGNLTFDLT